MKTLNKSEEVWADKFGENISAITRRKIRRLLRLQHRRLRLATLGGSTSRTRAFSNARGLDINSPLSAENHIKTCDFIGISNAVIPTTLRGSTTTSPLIVDTILRQQLDYIIIDYGRADHGAPDKS
jgi:Mrp family chromosome partitioning ATPase